MNTNLFRNQLALLLTISCLTVHAQDPFFSQPLSNSIYTNPALTGFTGYSRIQINQRIQWPNIPGSYYTTFVGADFSSKNNKLDIGMYGLYDNAGNGILKTYSQNLTLAHQLPITEKVGFRVGLNMGLISRSLNMSLAILGDPIDPRYGFIYSGNSGNPRVIVPNLGLGFAFHGDRFILGYSLNHFNQPNQSFQVGISSKLPASHLVHGALRVYQVDNNKYSIGLTGLYARQQDFTQVVMGIRGSIKRFSAAMMYRNDDALIFCLGYIGNRFQTRYSYDITTSKLTNKTGGSHEISLGILLGQRKENRISNDWIKKLF